MCGDIIGGIIGIIKGIGTFVLKQLDVGLTAVFNIVASIFGLEKGYEIAIAFENNLLDGNTDLNIEFESFLVIINNYLQKV